MEEQACTQDMDHTQEEPVVFLEQEGYQQGMAMVLGLEQNHLSMESLEVRVPVSEDLVELEEYREEWQQRKHMLRPKLQNTGWFQEQGELVLVLGDLVWEEQGEEPEWPLEEPEDTLPLKLPNTVFQVELASREQEFQVELAGRELEWELA